jgi:hypothetical protein
MLELKDGRLHGRYGNFMAVTTFLWQLRRFFVENMDLFGLPAIYRHFHGGVWIIRI